MKIATFFILSLAIHVVAATADVVKLDMALSIDGKEASNPMVQIEFGQTGMVESTTESGQGSYVEVLATRVGKDEVLMKFQVGKVISGKRQLLGQPQILTKLGERAEITQTEDNGRSFSLSVTPSL